MNARLNQTLPITKTTEGSLIIISDWISNNISSYIIAYFLPVAIIFSIINNLLVLVVFVLSKEVAKRITPSIRVYYIAMAISDISVCFPLQFTYFVGTKHLLVELLKL